MTQESDPVVRSRSVTTLAALVAAASVRQEAKDNLPPLEHKGKKARKVAARRRKEKQSARQVLLRREKAEKRRNARRLARNGVNKEHMTPAKYYQILIPGTIVRHFREDPQSVRNRKLFDKRQKGTS